MLIAEAGFSTAGIVFFLGIVLLVIAIIGGGLNVKEVAIPPMGLVPRLLSATLGAALLFSAFFAPLNRLDNQEPPQKIIDQPPAPPGGKPPPPGGAPPNTPAATGFAMFTDELGEDQESEYFAVELKGAVNGKFVISAKDHETKVGKMIPARGTVSYLVVDQINMKDGSTEKRTGAGTLDLKPGDVYELFTSGDEFVEFRKKQ